MFIKQLKKILFTTLLLTANITPIYSQNYSEEEVKKVKEVFKSVDSYLIDKQDPEKGTIYLEKLLQNIDFDYKKYKAEVQYRKAIIELQLRNYQKSIDFFKEAIDEFKKTKNQNRIGKCEKNMGICYHSINQRGNALKYYLSAEKKLIPDELPSLYSNLAGLFSNLGDNKTGLEYALKSYSLIKKRDNDLALIEIYGILGHIFTEEKNYERALEFYNKSLKICIKNKLDLYAAAAFGSIGAIEANKKQYNQAISKYLHAKKIFELKDYYNDELSIISLNIAESYRLLKDYSNAEKHAYECYSNCIKNNNLFQKSQTEISLGKINFEKKDYDQAISYFNKAIATSLKIENDNVISEAYLQLSVIYEKKNLEKIAFQYFKKHTSLDEKILLKEKQTETEELQIRFEVSQYKQNLKIKTQEIELLKFKSTQLKYQYALLILFSIVLLFFAIRQNKIIRISKRNEKFQEEINLLKEEALNSEVNFKNKQVTDFALQIQEQNNLLLNFKQKLNIIKNLTHETKISEEIKSLQLLINDSIDLNNEKVQLNTEIKNSQESFLFNLREKFPDLNEKEIQIVTYLRLNLNTKQIASQLNISEQSVNNYRTFIRKKIGLDKDKNLTSFLKEL